MTGFQLAISAWQLMQARSDLVAGRFMTAQREFSQARDGLQHSPLLVPLRLLPPANRQLHSIALLADMGLHGSRAAATGLTAARTQNVTQIDQLRRELEIIMADRQEIPTAGLVAPAQQALTDFDRHIREAQAMLPLLPFLDGIAGSNGSASYLVLQQDPAELRATGGFIGSVAFLDFNHGSLQPFQPVDIESIDGPHFHRTLGVAGDPKYVAPPAPFVRVLDPGDSWELRDGNFSPDFPTSARLAEFLLQRETGRKVAGVIAIDPYLIADLLTLTGPVAVPETGDVLTPQNFFETTLRKVELHRGATPRKSFLSYATTAVIDRLKKLPAHDWLKVAQIVEQACLSKDIQAYFDAPTLQAQVNHFGCGGQVPAFQQDGLLVVDENLNSNKDDFWISRSFKLEVQQRQDGSARHTLTIDYGPYPKLEQLTTPFIDWLRVYVPSGARLISASGIEAQQRADLGNTVLEGWVQFDFNRTKQLTLIYEVPPGVMGGGGQPPAVLWIKQAGRQHDPVSISISTGNETIRYQTDLSVDRRLGW